jgi:hypothetical protein
MSWLYNALLYFDSREMPDALQIPQVKGKPRSGIDLFFCVLVLKAAVLVALRSRITSYGTHTRQGESLMPL